MNSPKETTARWYHVTLYIRQASWFKWDMIHYLQRAGLQDRPFRRFKAESYVTLWTSKISAHAYLWEWPRVLSPASHSNTSKLYTGCVYIPAHANSVSSYSLVKITPSCKITANFFKPPLKTHTHTHLHHNYLAVPCTYRFQTVKEWTFTHMCSDHLRRTKQRQDPLGYWFLTVLLKSPTRA